VQRYLHVLGMPAMAVGAEHRRAFQAHLGPPGATMLAAAATRVVMTHDTLPDARLLVGHPGPDGGDDAARLMAGDHRFSAALEARTAIARSECRAIDVQIAAAHARRLDFQHHLARAWCGVREVAQLKPPVTQKHDASHREPPSPNSPVLNVSTRH